MLKILREIDKDSKIERALESSQQWKMRLIIMLKILREIDKDSKIERALEQLAMENEVDT